MPLSIQRVREILGTKANGKTDEQLRQLAEDLDAVAVQFYDDIQAAYKRDPEGARWLIHAHETGATD